MRLPAGRAAAEAARPPSVSFDLISDVFPSGPLWYAEPNTIGSASFTAPHMML
jgi:hypothetical protein